jgi:hypothetical protein
MGKYIGLGRLSLFFLLFTTSQVLALSCESVSLQNKQTCLDIANSNATMLEKEALIANLEYTDTYHPNHDYIFLRNSNIRLENPPDNVRTSTSTFIKDAWMSIFGVMPSVIYNNSLFCPTNTKVLTGFDYRIAIPSEYASASYPTTDQGDCRRMYSLISNSSENRVFVNNLYQGSGSLVAINIPSSTVIDARYLINSHVKVEHYNWDRYCCKTRRGKCIQYCYTCKFTNSEVQTDSLLLQDTLPVELYTNALMGTMHVTDKYESTTRFQTNFSNAIEISFNNSAYNFYEYWYAINYSKAPYYFATLQASDYKQEKISNLLKQDQGFVVKDTQKCHIRAFDFFNVFQSNCDLGYQETSLALKTDAFYYWLDEPITVSLIPQANYTVSYSNQTKSGSNLTFNAEIGKNKIHAELNGITQDRFIFVYDRSKVSLIVKLVLFFTFIYIFYKTMGKIARRVI